MSSPLSPSDRPFRRSRILIAPVSSSDPLIPSVGLSLHAARDEERDLIFSMAAEINRMEADNPQWLQRSRSLGPLLSALRFMAQGPEFMAPHQFLHRAYVEMIRRKLGDETALNLQKPWTPDEVWLIFQDQEHLGDASFLSLRAMLCRRLIRSLLGPWVKVAPFTVQSADCFFKCWELAFMELLPLLTGHPARSNQDQLPGPSKSKSDSDQAGDEWSAPGDWKGEIPDVRILLGTGTEALRHSLLLLDSFLPSDSKGRCWIAAAPGRPSDAAAEMTGGAHPMIWEALGLPDLGRAHLAAHMEEVCQVLKAENARLKKELEEARSGRQGEVGADRS